MIINSCFWQENSVISSNTNLAVYGQGLLKLTGYGDAIKAQRLLLALFYNITVRQNFMFSLYILIMSVMIRFIFRISCVLYE